MRAKGAQNLNIVAYQHLNRLENVNNIKHLLNMDVKRQACTLVLNFYFFWGKEPLCYSLLHVQGLLAGNLPPTPQLTVKATESQIWLCVLET